MAGRLEWMIKEPMYIRPVCYRMQQAGDEIADILPSRIRQSCDVGGLGSIKCPSSMGRSSSTLLNAPILLLPYSRPSARVYVLVVVSLVRRFLCLGTLFFWFDHVQGSPFSFLPQLLVLSLQLRTPVLALGATSTGATRG